MAEAATRAFGRLDIVVNNAAIRDVTPIDGIDFARWRQVTGIILDGAYLCREAGPRGPHARAGSGSAHHREALLGRRGEPEEVASVVRFLCGPEARLVTGQEWH